jgi:preprotein translocase subunit SecA
MDHLRAIDALRHGIGLRGYAQKDPKNEYKAEGFKLFEKLKVAIEDEVASLSLRVRVRSARRPDRRRRRRGAAPAARPRARGSARLHRRPEHAARAPRAAPTPEQISAAQQLHGRAHGRRAARRPRPPSTR